MKVYKRFRIYITLILSVLSVLILSACGAEDNGKKSFLDEIDFSNSQWLDSYMEQVLPTYGRDFTQSSAFSCSDDSGKFILLYASQKSVEDIRDEYLQNGAVEDGRNDETALKLTIKIPDGDARIINYYSAVCRMIEQELHTTAEVTESIQTQMEEAFPEEVLSASLTGTQLTSGKLFGSSVRYLYDDLDPYFDSSNPIFSRAYTWNGTNESYQTALEYLAQNSSNCSIQEAGATSYFEMKDCTLSIAKFPDSSGNENVSISLQTHFE